MKLLLLNPPSYPGTNANRELMGGYGMVSTSPMILPPLNLAYTASCLAGLLDDVNIYDAVALRDNFMKTLETTARYNPDIIGINTSTATVALDLNMVDAVKERLGIPVFVLGSHAAVMPDYIFENSKADFVVRGEPELTVVELIKYIGTKDILSVRGLSIRQDGKFFHNEDGGKISDLDTLPFPARWLLPVSKYYMPSLGKPFTTILGSRGCFFKCIYCPYHISQGEEVRKRSPENILSEIIQVYDKFGVRYLTFRDAIFTFYKPSIMRLCELLSKSKLRISWTCETAVRFLDEELLYAMKQAGCQHISVGLESGNEFLQNKYSRNKIKSKEHTREIFALCKKIGIGTRGFFMIGYPEETKEMIKETVDFSVGADPDTVQFTAVTPYPGTELYNTLENKDSLSFRDMTGYRPTNISRYLSPKELRRQIMRAYLKFYLRPKKLLQTLRDPLMFKQKLYRYFTFKR